MEELKPILPYFKRLKAAGMSSDEEDRPTENPESGSPPSYAVSKMIWRNPDVTNFMVQLDLYSHLSKLVVSAPSG